MTFYVFFERLHTFSRTLPKRHFLARNRGMRPDSLLRLWRYINHLLTYLLTYEPSCVKISSAFFAIGDDKNKQEAQLLL